MSEPVESIGQPRRFTVVMRGPAALIFQEDRAYGYDDYPTVLGPAQVSYRSRWLPGPGSVRIPGQLWVEVNGTGPNFETVVPVLASAGLSGLPVMSLACNVAIPDPELELAFDSSPTCTRREFLQAYVRPESNQVSSARLAAPDEIASVQVAVAQSEHRDALLRAADQYRIALDSWAVGRESLTLAHLWMAIEALTKVQRHELMRTHGVQSNQSLADKLKVAKQELDATVRRKYLLDGDTDCYKKAKEASDGFEHGFLGFDVIRNAAADVRERIARYVRQAIFRLAQVPQPTVDALMRHPFDKPMGNWPLVKFFTAHLVGDAADLAAPENTYPVVLWANKLKSVDFSDDGTMHVQFQDSIRPQLSPGIKLEGGIYQVWEGGSGIQLSAPLDPDKARAQVVIESPAVSQITSNITLAIDDTASSKWAQPLGCFLLNCNSLRHLALNWIQSLGGRPEYPRRPATFDRTIKRILRFLRRKRISKPLLERCRTSWSDAIELDAVRLELSGGVAVREGLVLPDRRKHGNAPLIADIERLVQINDKAINTAKELVTLLAELQALPNFRICPGEMIITPV